MLSNNIGKMQGASIDVQKNSSMEVHNSTFTNNSGDLGAGISAGFKTTVYITGSTFTDNRAARFGGALFVGFSSAANISSSVFLRNTALQGGAAAFQLNSSVYIAQSSFTQNYAHLAGVIMAVRDVRLHIKNSTFAANNASEFGAVFCAKSNIRITLYECIFHYNTANEKGSVIWATANTHFMASYCNFSQNTAPKISAFSLNNSSLSCSNVCFSDHSSNIVSMEVSIASMVSCIFINNSLTNDVIIEAEGKSKILFKDTSFVNNKIGGIIKASMTPVTISRCQFLDNNIASKGMIHTTDGVLMVNHSLIHNNTLQGTSGIFYYYNAIITSCTFTHNRVTDGYGLILSQSGRLQVTQSTFMYNNGDVIAIRLLGGQGRVDTVLDTCNFTGNNDHLGTLVMWSDGATLRTSNTIITAPSEGNKVAIYLYPAKGENMPSYMTYNTHLISGNIRLNSSATDTFLQDAQNAGLVVIENAVYSSYTVAQEESVFASCKYNNYGLILLKYSLISH